MQQLTLSTRTHAGRTVVSLRGELDIANADDLRRHLRAARQTYGDHVILDLEHLEFMDSHGLSVIVACFKSVTAVDGSLALAVPRPIIRRTLEITGLDRRLPLFDSVEDAAASPSGDTPEPAGAP